MIQNFYTTKIFPSKFFFKDLLPNCFDEKENKKLEKNILAWSKTEKTLNLSNAGGWHSPTNMHERREYLVFCKMILRLFKGIFYQEYVESEPKITAMWANVNYPNAYNTVHTHFNSKWSGAYYVSIPEKSGNLFFKDPRPAAEMVKPNYTFNDDMKDVCYTGGLDGMAFIFPSWLPHGVETNNSNKNRIAISFNVD